MGSVPRATKSQDHRKHTAMEKAIVLKSSSAVDKSSLKPHRHQKEQFSWFANTWDVTRLWSRIDGGELQEDRGDFKRTEVDADFINSYAKRILGLKDSDKTLSASEIENSPGRATMLMQVNIHDAKALPVEALKEPILFLETPKKGGGLLLMSEEHQDPGHVLGDGNHRVARAFLDGLDTLPALILSKKVCNEALVGGMALSRAKRAKKTAQTDRPKRSAPKHD
jgi:hypothetical protein